MLVSQALPYEPPTTTTALDDICPMSLTSAIGLEEFPVPHVQGHEVSGHRLRHESQTLIVALMRGGEPMAFGVNDVFLHAMFVHADEENDLRDPPGPTNSHPGG